VVLRQHTVRSLVDAGGKLGNGDLQTRLDVVEDLGILGLGDEGNGETLGAEATSTGNLMVMSG
jgi:hypothetical protein